MTVTSPVQLTLIQKIAREIANDIETNGHFQGVGTITDERPDAQCVITSNFYPSWRSDLDLEPNQRYDLSNEFLKALVAHADLDTSVNASLAVQNWNDTTRAAQVIATLRSL